VIAVGDFVRFYLVTVRQVSFNEVDAELARPGNIRLFRAALFRPNHLSLETGGILVGDEVAITLDVEFVKV